MSWSANNGAFGQGKKPSSQYTLPSQQDASVAGHSSGSEQYWGGIPPNRDYMPTGLASATSSWPTATFPDFPASPYQGEPWEGNQRAGGAHPGLSFSAPNCNADGTVFIPSTEMEGVASVSQQALGVMQRTSHAFHPYPQPSLGWRRSPGPWQPTPSWPHPVHTATETVSHSNAINSLTIGPGIPYFQPEASSVITGPTDRRVMLPGHFPSMSALHSVRHPTESEPVPVAPITSRSHIERAPPTNVTTFRCLWLSGGMQCGAVIAGDRKSITSHLRDEHDFTSDGKMIACAWASCTAHMQRRNIPRHIIACHLEIKVNCERCGIALSRADASKKHQLACTGPNVQGVMQGRGQDGRQFLQRS